MDAAEAAYPHQIAGRLGLNRRHYCFARDCRRKVPKLGTRREIGHSSTSSLFAFHSLQSFSFMEEGALDATYGALLLPTAIEPNGRTLSQPLLISQTCVDDFFCRCYIPGGEVVSARRIKRLAWQSAASELRTRVLNRQARCDVTHWISVTFPSIGLSH